LRYRAKAKLIGKILSNGMRLDLLLTKLLGRLVPMNVTERLAFFTACVSSREHVQAP